MFNAANNVERHFGGPVDCFSATGENWLLRYLGKYDVMVLCRKRIIRVSSSSFVYIFLFFFSPPPLLLFTARNQTVSSRDWIWKCCGEENLTFARLSDTSCGRVAIDDDKSSVRIFERWSLVSRPEFLGWVPSINLSFFHPSGLALLSFSPIFFFSSSILFPLLFFKSSMLFGNRSPCYSCKQQTRFHRCSEKLRRTVCKRLSNLRIASARSNFDKECS